MLCDTCTNRYYWTDKCRAFPEGIPLEILTNEFDHRRRYPGDHGIRFEHGEPINKQGHKGPYQ